MLPFDVFLDDVMPDAPGADIDIVRYHVARAVNVFAHESRMLVHTLPAIDVSAGVATYALQSDVPGLELAAIAAARFEGEPLGKATPRQLDANVRNWRTETGLVVRYTGGNSTSITLVAVPGDSSTGGLVVDTFVAPTVDSADGFDEALYRQYGDAIAAGALARLLRLQKKPWTNPQSAAAYAAQFNAGINTAKLRAEAAFAGAPTRTKAYPF